MEFTYKGHSCQIGTRYPHMNSNTGYWERLGQSCSKVYPLEMPFSDIRADMKKMIDGKK